MPEFSQVLRERTWPAHERAHGSAYMSALFDGELKLADYARLAAQYYFVYSALEAATDVMAADPIGARFADDDLRRLPKLERDLEFFYGSGWRSEIEELPATRRYADRIRQAGFEWSGGFVAHHYARYLGDLAGGQAVRTLLARNYEVTGPGALFYEFDRIKSRPRFRDAYRALLNEAPWSAAERERVVEETALAYELNIAMLADLADAIGLTRVASLTTP